MIISQLLDQPEFLLLNAPTTTNQVITGMFACDLLSHAMGFAEEGQILITVLNNINVLGVVHLLDLSAVIFPHNIQVQQPIIDKANELNIPLLSVKKPTAETVVLLHKLGV